MRARITWLCAAPALCLGLGACLAPPVETPTTTVVQETDVRVEQQVKNKVDILFMVDDSPSTLPKQKALKDNFQNLIKVLDEFGSKGNPAWYHIGVVTSDLGSAQSIACSKVGGKGAQLQALGANHDAGCVAPTGGINFIDYDQIHNKNNLPAGQSLPFTFGCMAAVGANGCGFEHQLEAAYRALHDCQPDPGSSNDSPTYNNCTIKQNAGFLRPDSLLVVVYVTDEDDCSAPPNTDLFNTNNVSTFGALNSYRCTNYGIMCNYNGKDQLMPYAASGGALMSCHSAPNPSGNLSGLPPAGQGKLFDISRYTDFFTKSLSAGGVRVDPNDVIVASIAAPPMPVSTDLQTSMGVACGTLGMNCFVTLDHSCNASVEFFGDPAVRIHEVVSSVKNHQETSICAGDYTSALTELGNLIISQIGPGCLSSPIANPDDPDCVVEDLSNADNSVIDQIPSCVRDGNVQPCWAYVENPMCPAVPNPKDPSKPTRGSIAIMRDQSQIPVGSHARVACATIALSQGQGGNTPSPSP